MNLLTLLRDALARIVCAQEALEDGDRGLAWELPDLELDVAGSLAAHEERWAA